MCTCTYIIEMVAIAADRTEAYSWRHFDISSGRLSCSPEEHCRYKLCRDTLEDVLSSAERLIPTIQHSVEAETALGKHVLQRLIDIRDSLSKIFRKLELEY